MPNPNTFDEASAATEEMFANEHLPSEETAPAEETSPAQVEQTEEDTSSETETPEAEEKPEDIKTNENETALGQAAQTAELAAEVAAQKDSQLQQAMAEIEALRQQNSQLQGAIDEMSKQNTEKIVEEALTPPTLDINGLAFADEETQKAAMAKFAEDMTNYNRNEIMKELSPAIEYAKKGMREAERTEVLKSLSQIPELQGINEMLPQLEKIINNNKWLSSDDMSMEEKYINAYAIARGVNSINTPPAEPPKEPTPEELMDIYNSNQAFQELVEKQRLEKLKESQQVPPFSASSGAVNAALNIKEKPKTLEEASKRTREMFGMM